MQIKQFIIILFLSVLACSPERHDQHEASTEMTGDSIKTMGLMLSKSQVLLANIRTQPAGKKQIGKTLLLNSRLAWNEELREVVSSRVSGRIEKLFFKETGDVVRKGAPLYTIYSESLLTLEQEFLIALESGVTDIITSATRKLELFGISRKQIEQLTTTKKVNSSITFVSPATGVVTKVNVSEGSYVVEGSALYQIAQTGKLWLESEVYADETSYVKVGDQLSVSIGGLPEMTTTVKFLSPEFRGSTQVVVIRADIPNSRGALKPGMQAEVRLDHSTRTSITVPADAVIRGGEETFVFVSTGENTFEPRRVKTGVDAFSEVEITQGLQDEEKVVVSGAYLLYSEFMLKKGTLTAANHHH